MKISAELTDATTIKELGQRVARSRLDRNVSQLELAERAGVSRATIIRFEEGSPITLVALIRTLRALGLIDNLDQLIPAAAASPLQLIDQHGKTRQRASARRQHEPINDPWTWGTHE